MSNLTPSEQTISFWENVLEDAKEDEHVSWLALEDAKTNPLATEYDLREAQKNYDAALKGRNMNELTLRGLKYKLNHRIYKKPE